MHSLFTSETFRAAERVLPCGSTAYQAGRVAFPAGGWLGCVAQDVALAFVQIGVAQEPGALPLSRADALEAGGMAFGACHQR